MAIFARAKGEKTACGRQGEGQVVGEMSATLVSIAKGDSAAIILDDLLDAIDYVDLFAQCDRFAQVQLIESGHPDIADTVRLKAIVVRDINVRVNIINT